MVTYSDILQAFCEYQALHNQSAWNDLFIIAHRRMSALISDRFRGRPPVEEFDGIITDATLAALASMQNRLPLCVDDVSRVFWNEYMNTVRDKFRELKKWRYMNRLAAILNSSTHIDAPETPAEIAKFWKKRKKYTRVRRVIYIVTMARQEASRENGKKGGRPRKTAIR